MQEDELRKHIESFYVKIRAGRDPKTGELHLQPTDFYDQMLALIQQYSKDYAQEQQKALIEAEIEAIPDYGLEVPTDYACYDMNHQFNKCVKCYKEQRLAAIKDKLS